MREDILNWYQQSQRSRDLQSNVCQFMQDTLQVGRLSGLTDERVAQEVHRVPIIKSGDIGDAIAQSYVSLVIVAHLAGVDLEQMINEKLFKAYHYDQGRSARPAG